MENLIEHILTGILQVGVVGIVGSFLCLWIEKKF